MLNHSRHHGHIQDRILHIQVRIRHIQHIQDRNIHIRVQHIQDQHHIHILHNTDQHQPRVQHQQISCHSSQDRHSRDGHSLWLSLSLTLSNMDNTSRVGNIPTSTSISSS